MLKLITKYFTNRQEFDGKFTIYYGQPRINHLSNIYWLSEQLESATRNQSDHEERLDAS